MTVDLVIPAYNEEATLATSIDALCAFLGARGLRSAVSVVIAENGSTDRTPEVAREAAVRHENVRVLRFATAGRGNALRKTWLDSGADVVGYMDADLATDLAALPELLAAFARGSDIAVGSRLRPGASVRRGLRREALSRAYNLLVRALLRTDLTDTQCGCKFLRRAIVADVLRDVQNDNWFFDTEFLVRAARAGYRISEVPVSWSETPGRRSTVRVIPTAIEEFSGILRLRRLMKG
jgi:glycosyltransferase involved in cell wall biosynthesis